MYQWVADGESVAGVRDRLNAMGVRSPLGLDTWSYSSVYYILTNEKYAGDVIMQKTIATDLYEHKVIKNTGQDAAGMRRPCLMTCGLTYSGK